MVVPGGGGGGVVFIRGPAGTLQAAAHVTGGARWPQTLQV